MPLTPAHAAVAWPLERLARGRLPLAALVVGTLSPDFEYVFHLAPRGSFAHSPLGLVVFCLPLGLAVTHAWAALVRPAIAARLPRGFLEDPTRIPGDPSAVRPTVLAVAVGAATHVAWDSFTHRTGWSVAQFAALQMPLPVGDPALPVYRLLQHLSTVVGLVGVVVWTHRAVDGRGGWRALLARDARGRWSRAAAGVLATAALGAALNGWRGLPYGAARSLGYAAVGAMLAFALALFALGLLARPGRAAT